jgi:hypothetical protein
MHKLKTPFVGAMFAAVVLASAPGSAMPIGDLGAASKSLSTQAQKVVWVCGWYRCRWRPAFVYPAPYAYYGMASPRMGLAALVVVNATSGGGLVPTPQCIGRDRGDLTNRRTGRGRVEE